MKPLVLDDVIVRLLEVRASPGMQVQLSESKVRQLCSVSRTIFCKQPNLLELVPPIKVCGDIHGQYSDLLRLFEHGGFPPQANYLFLGNYVDYGKQSLETMCLLLAFKIKYPENFFLLRGNHEQASINRINGFYDECKRRYNHRVWKVFTDCFKCLPVAALIDEKILCVHGGLSPDLHNLDQITNLKRPTDVPEEGLLCDLLWSDPDRDIRGWGMNERGVSYTFGADKVTEFLKRHDLDLICRSNQVVEDGYEFFANRQLVTIFSAPNFRGEYDNTGAIVSIDECLMCSFQILRPAEKKAKFHYGIAKPSKVPSGPSFGSAATAAMTRSSLRGPNVGSRRTAKPENALTGAKRAVNRAPDARTEAGKSVSSSSNAKMKVPGSTPTGANTGTRSEASTRARPNTTHYSSPGGARALGEYVGQSAKAVTRAVSPFNPERDGRRR